MKKGLLLGMMLICLICGSAFAAPAVTDGSVTAWIGENGYLSLQSEDGIIRRLPLAMNDLMGMTEKEVICLAADQRIISVNKDGTGSFVTDTETAAEQLKQLPTLEEGILTAAGEQISAYAVAMASDGAYLYFAERENDLCRLRIRPLGDSTGTALPGSRDAYVLALADRTIAEPVSMTVTKDALALTAADGSIAVMNLITGEEMTFPAEGNQTRAACQADNVLYRYARPDEQGWVLERSTVLLSGAQTPAETPAPTASSATAKTPAATKTPSPTKTPASSQDDDGTIHRGASGSQIRKIQKRLQELGYPTGSVDGVYGEQTQLAINLFCDAIHVREHNYITPRVQKKLFAKDAPVYDPYLPLKKGDRGVSVLYMQQRLKELGYDPEKLDGIYGDLTVKAVALFQQDHGIRLEEKEIPGEVASHEMLEILFAPDPTPSPATQTDL